MVEQLTGLEEGMFRTAGSVSVTFLTALTKATLGVWGTSVLCLSIQSGRQGSHCLLSVRQLITWRLSSGRREGCLWAYSVRSHSHSSQDLRPWNGAPAFTMSRPTSINLSWKLPHRHAQRSFQIILNRITLTIENKHHRILA